jgi:hypothetical protein
MALAEGALEGLIAVYLLKGLLRNHAGCLHKLSSTVQCAKEYPLTMLSEITRIGGVPVLAHPQA